jgi:hypothetical protein
MINIIFIVQSLNKNDMFRTEANTSRKNKNTMKQIDIFNEYPEPKEGNEFTVVIVGTNDIRGSALPKTYNYIDKKKDFYLQNR